MWTTFKRKDRQRTQPRRLGHRGTRHSARALPCCNSHRMCGMTTQSTGGAASCAATNVSRACPAARTPHNRMCGTTTQSSGVRRLAPQQVSAVRALPPALRITVARNDNTKFGGTASCAAANVSRACPAARTPHNRMCGTTTQSSGARGYNTPATRNIR